MTRLTTAQKQLREAEKAVRAAKGNKYHAQSVVLPDGTRFDSEREFERWGELQLQEAAGAIRALRRQVRFDFDLHGVHIGFYLADFVYVGSDGMLVVEDSKGFRTAAYRLKSKMMKAFHGVTVVEV